CACFGGKEKDRMSFQKSYEPLLSLGLVENIIPREGGKSKAGKGVLCPPFASFMGRFHKNPGRRDQNSVKYPLYKRARA
ncbi:MAG: hypothetical protein IKX85_05095, partial [Clostridia bacterium]|nr:hypothetical protein [Clostridia bacterium]